MNVVPETLAPAFTLDTSDAIHADYIIDRLTEAPRGTLVAIDYLQLLDQKRETPEINRQISDLKSFADRAGLVLLLISQIDRKYDLSAKALPDMDDVRLPNPLDLSLFTKSCFMKDGEVRVEAVA